jgi:hypothetical protein
VSARTRACAALLAVAVLAGCVGPARTVDSYRGKALRAAHDAVSQLETARLTVETMLAGRLQHLYTERVLSDSEDALSSIQQSFDSIQPPNDKTADKLRSDLDTILSDGNDALGQLRIAARRHDDGTLRSATHDVELAIDRLDHYLDEQQ